MDEPLSALDRLTKDEILPFLERLHEQLALPVIYISHDMSEIERLADHLVLMENGRVVASRTSCDNAEQPRSAPGQGPRRHCQPGRDRRIL